MDYRLLGFTVEGPIDKIRGEDSMVVNVKCKFLVAGQEVEISGLATCEEPTKLNKAYEEAIKDAREKVKQLNGDTTANLAPVVRELINTDVAIKVKNTPRTDLDKMYEKVNEDKQVRINYLCEALGIDCLDITDWTMVEALVCIEALERIAKPLESK